MEATLGRCPACPDHGHSCWTVTGTLCGGEVQGTFAQKEMNCLKCKVYRLYNIRTGAQREQLINEHKAEMARYANGDAAFLDGKTTEKALALAAEGLDHRLEAQIQARTRELVRINERLKEEIEERKHREQDLRESEEQFRGLVEQSITGIYIIQDGKFAYINPRFAEILGYRSADELSGGDPLQLIVERDRGSVAENSRQLLAGEVTSIDRGIAAICRDGSTIEVSAHSAPARFHGRPAIIGLLQDITEKRRAEQQIQDYVAQLEAAFMNTVKVATTLGEMRDPYTAGHQRRVAELAVAIGAELGLDARRLEGLRVAGYLHDLGKITIPAEILSKPGRLSTIEYQMIQGHPQAGYDVLKDVKFPWPVAEVALQHHERVDGSGYPQGLKGEAILLEARVMAVADVVEAMSSHRPYRAGLGMEKTLAEIERGRGTAYDPAVADACLKLFRRKGYVIPA